jgi:hypothetical protein
MVLIPAHIYSHQVHQLFSHGPFLRSGVNVHRWRDEGREFWLGRDDPDAGPERRAGEPDRMAGGSRAGELTAYLLMECTILKEIS